MTRQKEIPDTKAELKKLAMVAIEAYEATEDADVVLFDAVDRMAEVLGELCWTSCSYQGYWIGWDILENGDLDGPYIRRTETIALDNL